MLIDQSLSEAVIALQRHDLAPETREVVDEAARLLGDGREGEARALIEKADALIALASAPTRTNGGAKLNGGSGPAIQAIIVPLAAKLAAGFTEVLTSVLEDIHRYAGEEIHAVANAIEEHIENVEAGLRETEGARERLDARVQEQQTGIEAAQRAQEDIWSEIRALQDAGREQTESISRVATATDELSNHLVNHVDIVASRFEGLEERVSALDRFVQDVPGQFEAMVARLDGHTEALRHLEERQSQRVSTLNQVLDSLARLKEPESPEMGLTAVA